MLQVEPDIFSALGIDFCEKILGSVNMTDVSCQNPGEDEDDQAKVQGGNAGDDFRLCCIFVNDRQLLPVPHRPHCLIHRPLPARVLTGLPVFQVLSHLTSFSELPGKEQRMPARNFALRERRFAAISAASGVTGRRVSGFQGTSRFP